MLTTSYFIFFLLPLIYFAVSLVKFLHHFDVFLEKGKVGKFFLVIILFLLKNSVFLVDNVPVF